MSMMRDMREPADILDPKHYAGVRRPFDSAETLPPWCYTSPRFYEREKETIFNRYWNCLGHQSRVPEAGSYITLTYCDVPLVIVRGKDLVVRAFINSCTHRGSVVMEGEGTCSMMKCPYHAWAFSLEGDLIGTPLFEEHENFQKSEHGLTPVRLELWCGLMWINLDANAPDLHTYLGDLAERVAPWKADEMVCVARREFPVKANWKFYAENWSDGYHVPFVHQTTLNKKRVSKRDFHDPSVYLGNYLMHYTYFSGSRGTPEGQKKLPELDLPPELKIGTFFPYVHANAMVAFAIDMVSCTEIIPEGPGNCRLFTSTMVPKSTTELPDFQETLELYLNYSDTVRDEDVIAAERQQRGAESAFNRVGCFTPQDKLVHDHDLWILDRVVGNAAP
jgi:choline monooxygenase